MLPGKRSLYDDFSYSHASVEHSAHNNAYFLPWRALFLPAPGPMLTLAQTAGSPTCSTMLSAATVDITGRRHTGTGHMITQICSTRRSLRNRLSMGWAELVTAIRHPMRTASSTLAPFRHPSEDSSLPGLYPTFYGGI